MPGPESNRRRPALLLPLVLPLLTVAALRFGHDPVEYILMALSVGIALTGIALAHRMYMADPALPSHSGSLCVLFTRCPAIGSIQSGLIFATVRT